MFLFLLFFLFAYNNEDLRMFKYKANKNTKKELFYDKTSNEIIELNIKSKIFFSIFFFIFAVIILIWAVKLKQNNIHTWSKLK